MKDDISTPISDSGASPNEFESDKPGTSARTQAEAGIERVRAQGGVFVDAVRATRMPMVLTDPNLPGNPIVFANESFLRLSGYSMDEVLGQQPHFMNGPDTDPKDAARFREMVRCEQDEILETVQYRKNGQRFVATVLLSAFKDDAGRTLHHFMSWLDVTRRVDAEHENANLRELQAALHQSEERQAFLLRLTDTLRSLSDPVEIQTAAMKLLAEHFDVMRAGYLDVDLDGDTAFMAARFERNAPSTPDSLRLSDFGPDLAEAFRAGQTRLVRDAEVEAQTEEQRAAHRAIHVRSWIIAPLVKNGRLIAIVGVVDQAPRNWTNSEVQLVTELAERTWEAAERARSEMALRDSEAEVAAELHFATLLRKLAERLVTEDSLPAIYDEILSAAIAITSSDAGTVQVYDPDTKSLVLLVTKGFPRKMTDHFHRVDAHSSTACGVALRTGVRTFVDFDDDTDDKACLMHVEAGYRSAQASPLLSRSGEPLGMLNTHWNESHHRSTERELRFLDLLARQAADLIERRQAERSLRDSERHAQTLLAELQHRVRNTLAVVRSIARRTSESSDSAEEMMSHLSGRLNAFSRVQSAVTRSPGEGVDIKTIIEDELLAVATREGEHLAMRGPSICLKSKAAESISLAIHELATNAVKYGALSVDGGRIKVDWQRVSAEGCDELHLEWLESGLEKPPSRAREGFGHEMLLRTLPYDLGAETSIEFTADGLRFTMNMSLGPDVLAE